MNRPDRMLSVALLAAGMAACGAPASHAPSPPAPPPVRRAEAPAPPAPATPPAAAATVVRDAKPAALHVVARREVDAAVFAIALDKPPLVAALAENDVWLREASGWRREALPAAGRHDAKADLGVFFGRDFKPRIIGTRAGTTPATSVTLRLLPEGVRSAAGEIGRLASPGGLVAVLGTDDPEIVCKPGDQCVVKRRSGWTYLASPPDIARVAVASGAGWAVAGKRLLRLAEAWQEAGPPGSWEHADALFALADRAWVIEHARGSLHAFEGGGWTVVPSPIAGPRALWGTAPDALWLAGDGGLARFDGAAWRVCDAPEGPLAAVLGRGAGEVWTGGAHGLFRVEVAP